MPWQGGGKEGCVRLHCQEPGVVELLVHLEARQTNSRLFPTLSLTCTAFQETRHMLSGQPQLEYHGAGTRYAVPDLPYKCNLCHKKFRDMGGMMQHQVWKKKHGLKQVVTWVNPCNFSGLCPPCCEPKIGPSLKEESSRQYNAGIPSMLMLQRIEVV